MAAGDIRVERFHTVTVDSFRVGANQSRGAFVASELSSKSSVAVSSADICSTRGLIRRSGDMCEGW